MLLSFINQVIPIFNDMPGYGYGVLMVLSMAVSIFFGVPALLVNWSFKDRLKENKDASSIFKYLCFLLAPGVIHWIVIVIGTIFKLL